MGSKMNSRKISMNAVIEQALKKEVPLTADFLIRITNSDINSYELLDMLCIYITACDCVQKGKEIKAISGLKLENAELRQNNEALIHTYNSAIKSLLESKESEINMKKNEIEYVKKITELKSEISKLEGELMRMKLDIC